MPTSFAEFHEEAAAEYDAAFDWYLEHSPDAAFKFDAEVHRALAQILEAPGRWATGPFSTRRFLLRQFPFIPIYRQRMPEQFQAKFRSSRSPTPAGGPNIGRRGCDPSYYLVVPIHLVIPSGAE